MSTKKKEEEKEIKEEEMTKSSHLNSVGDARVRRGSDGGPATYCATHGSRTRRSVEGVDLDHGGVLVVVDLQGCWD